MMMEITRVQNYKYQSSRKEFTTAVVIGNRDPLCILLSIFIHFIQIHRNKYAGVFSFLLAAL